MKPHQLIFPDTFDYLLFLKVAEAAGFQIATDGTVSRKPDTSMTEEERQYHLSVVAKGGSGLSIPDPLAWQREQRADRNTPFEQ